MVRKGLEQSKKFSWEKAARETMEVYKSVELVSGQRLGESYD